jgi:hypothetical protein
MLSEFNGKVIILKADGGNQLDVKEIVTDDSYKMLSDAVGGYIEALTLGVVEGERRVTVWLNEEGKLNNLPPNFALVEGENIYDIVMGDIIITSTDDEGETVGLTDKEIEFVRERFNFNLFGRYVGIIFKRVLEM